MSKALKPRVRTITETHDFPGRGRNILRYSLKKRAFTKHFKIQWFLISRNIIVREPGPRIYELGKDQHIDENRSLRSQDSFKAQRILNRPRIIRTILGTKNKEPDVGVEQQRFLSRITVLVNREYGARHCWLPAVPLWFSCGVRGS